MNKTEKLDNLKILVVDDSKTMLRIITNSLIRVGIPKENIDTAEDGIQAWDLLSNPSLDLSTGEEKQYDIILTDWNMPNRNGLELVKLIRKSKEYEDTPIVMITTEGGKIEVITALKAGVNNYIVKPFTPQVLQEKLRAILGY
jgi:two-component system chemotaxis response regulator CheY